jgi:hypothetical protein
MIVRVEVPRHLRVFKRFFILKPVAETIDEPR